MKLFFAHIIFFMVLCGILVSCSTKKEYVYVNTTDTLVVETHDTIHTFKVDTIQDTRMIVLKDTVREVITKVITLKESGDTIREIVNNNIYHKVYEKDSTDKYRTRFDSIQNVLNELKESKNTDVQVKEVVKTKNGIWKYVAYVLATLLIAGLVYIVILKIKK